MTRDTPITKEDLVEVIESGGFCNNTARKYVNTLRRSQRFTVGDVIDSDDEELYNIVNYGHRHHEVTLYLRSIL